MAACAMMIKMISSWVRIVLSMPMKHMSLGSQQCAVVSTALVAGVSLLSTFPAGYWAYFSTYITPTDWHQDPVLHAVLDLSKFLT